MRFITHRMLWLWDKAKGSRVYTLDRHRNDTRSQHPYGFGCSPRQINDTPTAKRATIGDTHHHLPPVLFVGHL